MRKLNILFVFICLSFLTFAQDLRIKQAEVYFNAYRFADAKNIYNELCFKEKIDVNKYITVYRKASLAGIKANDYWFALKALEKIETSEAYNSEDAYNNFKLRLFLGQYEKLNDIAQLNVIKNDTTFRKRVIEKVIADKNWEVLPKDSLGSKIEFLSMNSGKGDFAPVLHPKGFFFSSKRNVNTKIDNLDNNNFIDQYYVDAKSKKIKHVGELNHKRHDGASYYDSINKVWYTSKNLKTLKGEELTKTGIFIYNETTKKEFAFPYNNEIHFIAQPYYHSATKTLYFSSDMNGGFGAADLWKSTFKDSSWSQPENLGAVINTHDNEMFPFISDEDLYFASNGHPGLGGLDVFVSKITANSFEKPSNIGYPLNSYGDDFALVLKDGVHGYYTNNRKDFKFVDNIYAVTLMNNQLNFMGTVLANTKEREPIVGMKVVVKDEKNNIIDTLQTNDKGVIHFKAKKDKKYTFFLGDEDFEFQQEVLNTSDIKGNDTIKKDFLLTPRNVLINTIAIDERTNEPLANALVKFTNKETGEIKEVETDELGRLKIKLPRNFDYDIDAHKKGYNQKLDFVSTKTKESELDKVVKLSKIKVGDGFKIENVFYDYGKATLRPESKVELDKLATFLLENNNIKVELSSHTDSRGGDKANQKLSQARAQSCVDYLLTKGVTKANIVAKGYGETKLVNKCKNNVKCTEEEHQANRRTELKVLSIK